MHKETPQIQGWLNFWFPPCLYISVALLHSFKARSVQLHMTKNHQLPAAGQRDPNLVLLLGEYKFQEVGHVL